MKHIIIALDGTFRAAYADPYHSNVYRMNLAFDYRDKRGNPQTFIYVSGVGTYQNWLKSWVGATGDGLEQLILGAYVNLLSNYEKGDKIYLFGFSRGAVAARALAGLINYSGLLLPDQSALVHAAWNHFLDRPSDFDFKGMRREAVHKAMKIEFLGVWDTVFGRNSEKFIEQRKFTTLKLRSLALDPGVKTGVQILAMDETRNAFIPLLWNRKKQTQTCEQIWMPGVHTDVGGGYGRSLLSNLSLLSMISKLSQHCPELKFDDYYIREVLLDDLLTEDQISVNDEWEGYPGWPFDSRAPRKVAGDAFLPGQSIHPVARLLADRRITFKSKEQIYKYTFQVPPEVKLNVARFDNSIVDWKKIESGILDKF